MLYDGTNAGNGLSWVLHQLSQAFPSRYRITINQGWSCGKHNPLGSHPAPFTFHRHGRDWLKPHPG